MPARDHPTLQALEDPVGKNRGATQGDAEENISGYGRGINSTPAAHNPKREHMNGKRVAMKHLHSAETIRCGRVWFLVSSARFCGFTGSKGPTNPDGRATQAVTWNQSFLHRSEDLPLIL